jgi:hypothetical protein
VIPIHVSGTATDPQYNLVEGTAQHLVAQAAACQVDKFKGAIKNEATKSLMKLLGQ